MDGMAQTMGGRRARVGGSWRTLIACVILIAAALPASARELQYEAPPEWVTPEPVPVVAHAETDKARGGVQYLLVDRQTRVDANELVAYHHFATQAMNGDGVEQAAHITIDFDPSYETLALHSVKVHRGGHAMSRLNPANVHVLQREKDLEARIYDGRKTANVLLEDVRIGDVVEVDYTIRGLNPAFRGPIFGDYDLQWSVPVQVLHARLVAPEGHELHMTPRNTTQQPEVRRHGGWIEYVWRARDVPAREMDDDEPGWYDPDPLVQWSEYPDWGAIAAWALPLYRESADQGPEFKAIVESIAHANARPEDRLLASLRFVQREVRYLGIEIGVGSLAPRPPREVLQRRFGDCKDKAVLLVSLLQALGVEARPALVNTRLRRELEHYLPSPGRFDHVVVRARLDGRDYWIDPTRAVQKGTLQTLSQADFERALVIEEGTRELQHMDAAAVHRREVHSVYDLSGGRGKPVTLQVTTVYHGASAESVRQGLANESRDETQRGFLNFYARYYPDIATDKPFTVSDDDGGNALTVTESYRLGDRWEPAGEDQKFKADFPTPELDDFLRVPDRTVRSGPLALPYPVEIDSLTEIRMNKDWPISIKPGSVSDPAFQLSYDVSNAGNVVKSREVLVTRADHVPADRVAAYSTQVQRARDALGIRLHLNEGAPRAAGLNWPILLLGLCMLGGACWVALRLYRHDPPPSLLGAAEAPRGISGWLLLPALAVISAPFRIGKDLFSTLPAFELKAWSDLTTAGGDHYSAWWAPTLLFELGSNVLLLVLALAIAVLFFRKRTSLPRAFIGFLWFDLAVVFVDEIATRCHAGIPQEQSWLPLIRQFVHVVIWSGYFLRSRRVKATFVERLRQSSGAAAALPESAGMAAPQEEPGSAGAALP
jgi:transglutaminase-like putative cysteine protease